jgi:excisionase family DNA binding protein
LSQTVATAGCNSGNGEGADSNGSKPSQPVSAKARSFVPPVSQATTLHVVAAVLTAQEAARVLHLSTATVYRLCSQGELPHIRVSNAIRITPADLLAVIARRRANCTSHAALEEELAAEHGSQ